MYFEAEPDGIRVYHSINRFDDRALLGGASPYGSTETCGGI